MNPLIPNSPQWRKPLGSDMTTDYDKIRQARREKASDMLRWTYNDGDMYTEENLIDAFTDLLHLSAETNTDPLTPFRAALENFKRVDMEVNQLIEQALKSFNCAECTRSAGYDG